MSETTYKINEPGSRPVYTRDADVAEEYSEIGFRVTAMENVETHPATCSREHADN